MSKNENKETTIMNEDIQDIVKEGEAVQEDVAEKEEKKGFVKKGNKDKARIEELEKKVNELEDKVAKDKEDYIRLMAEFDNFRRRTSQEKLELVKLV